MRSARRVRSGTAALLALASALLLSSQGCGARSPASPPASPAPAAAARPAAADDRVAWPSGAFAFGDAALLARIASSFEGLGDTPLRRAARELAARVASCEAFAARVPASADEGAVFAALAQAARCAEPRDDGLLEHPRREGAAIVLALPTGPGMPRALARVRAERDGALRVDLVVDSPTVESMGALFVPSAVPPGKPRLGTASLLARARFRPEGGIDIARLVADGGQADRLFQLKSALLSGAVLQGVWELAVYEPAPGRGVPGLALGLDLASPRAGRLAVDAFVANLEATWPIRHTPARFAGGASGACFLDLRILPEFAPCYAIQGDLLIVAWNPSALERTLSQEPATPLLDAAGGIALHFAHWPAADRVLAETSGGSATGPEYGWQRAIVSPRPASDSRLRFSLLLQEASGT